MAPSTKSGKKAAPVSLTTMAKLKLPVSRIGKSLKKGRYTRRVSPTAAVFLTAVIEYCTSELLKLSGEAAKVTAYKKRINKKGESHEVKGKTTQHQIRPRHITLAVSEDEDLGKLLSHVTIAGGRCCRRCARGGGGEVGHQVEEEVCRQQRGQEEERQEEEGGRQEEEGRQEGLPEEELPQEGLPQGLPEEVSCAAACHVLCVFAVGPVHCTLCVQCPVGGVTARQFLCIAFGEECLPVLIPRPPLSPFYDVVCCRFCQAVIARHFTVADTCHFLPGPCVDRGAFSPCCCAKLCCTLQLFSPVRQTDHF